MLYVDSLMTRFDLSIVVVVFFVNLFLLVVFSLWYRVLNFFSCRSFVSSTRVCMFCCVFFYICVKCSWVSCLKDCLLFVWWMIAGFSFCNNFHGFCFVAEIGWLYRKSCAFLWRVIRDNINNCKVMGPTARWRGRLQVDGADCKAVRQISRRPTARRGGWQQGDDTDCKATRPTARLWDSRQQGEGADSKVTILTARWRDPLQGDRAAIPLMRPTSEWGGQSQSREFGRNKPEWERRWGWLQGDEGAFVKKTSFDWR